MASLCCFRMMHYYCLSFKRAVNITTITLCTFLELLRYCDAVNSVQGFYYFQDIFWTQFKIYFFQISMNEIVVACFSTKILVVSQKLLIWVILSLRLYVHNFTTYNMIFALMSKAIDLKLTIEIAKLWNSPNQYCR